MILSEAPLVERNRPGCSFSRFALIASETLALQSDTLALQSETLLSLALIPPRR